MGILLEDHGIQLERRATTRRHDHLQPAQLKPTLATTLENP